MYEAMHRARFEEATQPPVSSPPMGTGDQPHPDDLRDGEYPMPLLMGISIENAISQAKAWSWDRRTKRKWYHPRSTQYRSAPEVTFYFNGAIIAISAGFDTDAACKIYRMGFTKP